MLFEEPTAVDVGQGCQTPPIVREPDRVVVDSSIAGQEITQWCEIECNGGSPDSPELRQDGHQSFSCGSLPGIKSSIATEPTDSYSPFPFDCDMSLPQTSDLLVAELEYLASISGRRAALCSHAERPEEYNFIAGHLNDHTRLNAGTQCRLEAWQDLFK